MASSSASSSTSKQPGAYPRLRSRTPTPPPPPVAEGLRLPALEALADADESEIQAHLKKKRFLHRLSSHPSSPASSPSKPKPKLKTVSTSDPPPELARQNSAEDEEWDDAQTYAPLHPPSSHRHGQGAGGIRIAIRHKGKLLVRNPEEGQSSKRRREARREAKRGTGEDVTLDTKATDSVRRKGSYVSQQGVRGKLNRAGSRIAKTAGGLMGDSDEEGSEGGRLMRRGSRASTEVVGGESLRQTSTRASMASSVVPPSPGGVGSKFKSLSHIVTHPFSHHPSDQPPSAAASGFSSPFDTLSPTSSTSAPPPELLLSPTITHAAGEDPSLPPSSTPLGMTRSNNNPPQLPRLNSGQQLQTIDLRPPLPPAILRPSTSGSSTPSDSTHLPSPPATPSPPHRPLESTHQPSQSSFLPPSSTSPPQSRPTSVEFLSTLPQDNDRSNTSPSPKPEPLPWGRDSAAASPTPITDVTVTTWADFQDELTEEEERSGAGIEGDFVDGKTRQKVGQGEVVWERLWENQRGVVWFGTPNFSSSSLLPTDPSPFTRPGSSRDQCKTPYNLDSYQLPDGTWSWASSWMINMRNDGQTDEKGWEYNSWFRNKGWHAVLPWHGWKGWVRRRQWIRLRIHPPPPEISTLSPPPSPTAPHNTDLPLPVTDASSTPKEHVSPDITGLGDAVKDLASKMLDRERLDTWREWLDLSKGRRKEERGLREMVEESLPTLLATFTHPSSAQLLLVMLREERPDWTLTPERETEEEREERETLEGREAGDVRRTGSGLGIVI